MRCANCRLDLGDGALPVNWSDVNVAPPSTGSLVREHDCPHWSGRPKEYLHAPDDVSASPSDGPEGPLWTVGARPASAKTSRRCMARVTSNSALMSQDRD